MMVIRKHEKLVDKVIAAVCSLAVFAFVVGLLIFTRPSEVKAGSNTTNINGVDYSSDYKLQMLNIVPDESYDEIGPLFGNDAGSVSWENIQEASKNYSSYGYGSLNDFVQNIAIPYLQYVNDSLLGGGKHGYWLSPTYNGKCYEFLYSDGINAAIGGMSDLSKITLKICQPVPNPVETWKKDFYPLVDDDGNEIRDLFSYCVFGNNSMEGKVQYVVKKAKDVTIDDINRSQLVYISVTSHNTTLRNIYDKLHNTTSPSVSSWTLGSDYDLKADVALELFMLNATQGKAVIIESADKNPSSDGKYSNVARMSILLCGIERDQFLEDFAFKSYTTPDNGYSYKGKVGGVKLEDNSFNIYFRDKKLTWSANIFTTDNDGKGYPSYLGIPNNTQEYPIYIATDEHKQRMLNKYTYEFNSSNFMTSQMFDSDVRNEIKDFDNGTYWGNTTSEALTVTYRNTATSTALNTSKSIMYILGAHKGSVGTSLNILEIEPSGFYRYTNTTDYQNLIKEWFAISSTVDCDLDITSVSMNAFIGMTEDIRSTYDLVIVGAYTGAGLNSDIVGNTTYNDGNTFNSSKNYAVNGNDLTDKAYDKLLAYAKAGLPIVLDTSIYFGDTDVIEEGTNMMKLRKSEFTKELLKQNVVYSNISYVDTTVSADMQNISGTLFYVDKPTSTIRPADAKDYDGTEGCLLDPSLLSSFKFKGTVNSLGDYSVKVYIDRNCDSLFSEDTESETPELVYFDKTSTGSVKDGVKWDKGEEFNTIVKLPTALTGYIAWKVEVTDLGTGAVAITKGAFAIKPTVQKTIKVLQIESDVQDQHIDLTGEDFNNCFNDISGLIGMDIEVVLLKKSEFNALKDPEGKLSEKEYKSKYLADFSIIVLGLSDNYGNDATDTSKNLNEASVSAIEEYIANGNSAFFTHDNMSYKTLNGNKLENAGSADKLNLVTKRLKTTIGMKDGYALADSLVFKLSNKSPFNGSTGVEATSKTRNTNKVKQLNEGEITKYPYDISENGSTTISVAETHGQYFALDLDYMGDGNDVVVWYTLEQSNDSAYKTSNYFKATGQDAMSNYYVYSVGNITYSSAGHSLVEGEGEEMQLFVNTFVRAILSGNTAPVVSYPDAVLEKENQYTKYTYLDFTGDMLTVNYAITDPDMVEGVGQISSAYLFYDKDESGTYNSGDVIIGYIKENGSIVKNPLPSGEKSVRSGKTYSFDLWNVASNCGVDTSTVAEMKTKLVNDTLKIGIVATDSNKGVGYATLLHVRRDLFDLV